MPLVSGGSRGAPPPGLGSTPVAALRTYRDHRSRFDSPASRKSKVRISMKEHEHAWNNLLIDFTGRYHIQACRIPDCDKERRWKDRNGRLRLLRSRTGKPIVFKSVPMERLLRRPPPKDALTVLRVPAPIRAEIRARAGKEQISVSSCVRRLIYAGLDKRGLTGKEKAALRAMLA